MSATSVQSGPVSYFRGASVPSNAALASNTDSSTPMKDSNGEGSLSTTVRELPDFSTFLLMQLNNQRKKNVMCDVTVVTEDGHTFRAHKAILAACSRYLETELHALSKEEQESSNCETVIHLGMISSHSFETLLKLIYTSKLFLTEENVSEVLLAADILDLDLVSDICRQFLRSQIKSKSVAYHKSSRDSFHGLISADSINKNVPLDEKKNKNQRIGSNDSTSSSSSGFSSCSSTTDPQRGIMEFDGNCSLSDENADDSGNKETTFNHTSRSSSALNFSSATEVPDHAAKRPLSAPASQARDSNSPLKRMKADDNVKKQIDDCTGEHLCNSDCSDDLFNSPQKINDGCSQTEAQEDERSRISSDSQDKDFDPSRYKVKSEVRIFPGFYPSCDTDSDKQAEEVPPTASNISTKPLDEQLYNSASLAVHSTPSNCVSSHTSFESPTSSSYCPPKPSPIFRTHSTDSYSHGIERQEVGQSGYVDLCSTAHLQKDRHPRIFENAIPASMAATPAQGIFRDTSQFLASLYMLRSQSLNPVGFLNSNFTLHNQSLGNDENLLTGGPQHPPSFSALKNQSFSKRQLQHSNSVMTPNALICKICRLEFTSEWSLSMHYRLYHPLSCLYTTRNGQADMSLAPDFSQPEQNPAESTTQNALPFLRSISSPCKTDTKLVESNNKDLEPRMFDMKEVNKSPVYHKCYHCKKDFPSIFLLRKHKATEHMKRPFKCQRCNAAFPNKAGLSVHLRSHTGERPYRCKICDKAFTQLGHVQRHQKVHTGEKPYQCPLCQARVRDKASMHYHILAHQGVKPFKCDQCDARFTKRSSLVKHKNVHTGAFLYQCPQCKASFREKASLSRHVRSQHREPCYTASLDLESSPRLEVAQPAALNLQPGNSPVNLTVDPKVDAVRVV